MARVLRLLKLSATLSALYFIAAYVYLAISRMGFPFEIEWLEGSALENVRRVAEGKALYVKPSLSYVSFLYNPLYYYVSAGVSALVPGGGFMPLRLVSFVSSLGSFAIIYLFARKETGSAFWGLLASGLFAATFRVSGSWFDIARVDSLFLFLLLAGLYLARFHRGYGGAALSGVLLALAYFAKQTALVAAAPAVLYCIVRNPRRGLVLAAADGGLVALGIFLLDRANGGWYSYYTLQLPKAFGILTSIAPMFWRNDMLTQTRIMFLLAVLFLVWKAAAWRRWREDGASFYAEMLVGMVGASWLARMNLGAARNVLFPAYAAIAVAAAVMAHGMSGAGGAARRGFVEAALLSLILLQFLRFSYGPLPYKPSRKDWEACERYVGMLKREKGEVMVPYHTYIAAGLWGKGQAGLSQMTDVQRGPDGPAKGALVAEMKDAFAKRRFSAVYLNQAEIGTYPLYLPGFLENYRLAETVPDTHPIAREREYAVYVFRPAPTLPSGHPSPAGGEGL